MLLFAAKPVPVTVIESPTIPDGDEIAITGATVNVTPPVVPVETSLTMTECAPATDSGTVIFAEIAPEPSAYVVPLSNAPAKFSQ